MAVMVMNLYSRYLQRSVPVTAIIPVDGARFAGEPLTPMEKPFKTLYLLNGYFGSNMDWLLAGNAFGLAAKYNMAVICPSGENHFYVDNAVSGEAYGRFIGEELVEQTRRIFHLSDKKEDTFIGGLSMGGYGSLRNGLKYCDTFGYIAALSAGIMDDESFIRREEQKKKTEQELSMEMNVARPSYFEMVFGDLSKHKGSDNDLEALFLKAKAADKAPKIYLACGTEDSLISANRRYRDFLQANNADLKYEEGPGVHDFVFWKEYMERAASDFLPVEAQKMND